MSTELIGVVVAINSVMQHLSVFGNTSSNNLTFFITLIHQFLFLLPDLEIDKVKNIFYFSFLAYFFIILYLMMCLIYS